MNMNQMHSQLEYQTGLLNQPPQQNQMLPDHSSVFGYQAHTQPSQTNVLYNLNFNHHMDQLQPYDPSGSVINANAIYHHHHTELTPNQHENIDTSSSTASGKNHRATGKASNGIGPKRQKKMKLNNDLDGQSDLLEQSNPNYLYQNNNYYHKQSLIGSSSITSSNSSSTSSSPLSSSSPSHHQAHSHQLTQMGISNGMNIPGYNANGKQSMLGQSNFSATGVIYPVHNQLFGYMDDMDSLKHQHQQQQQENNANNGTGYDVMMDTNNSMEEFSQRAKLKKSKKDPISEYDSELAESIEFELGLKKQNGPRKNSWGNLSYAELITRAIESSSDQRLTLSQIYDWIVKYVPYFKEKFDRTSSAGWKNSIRHNLSLHNRFIRVQNESSGKSSWWMINPDMSKYSLNTPMCSTNMVVPNSSINGNPYSFDPTQVGQMMPNGSEDNNNHNLIDQPLNEPTLSAGVVDSSDNNNDVYNLNQLPVVKEKNKDGSNCSVKLEQTEQSSEAESHLSPEYQAANDKQKVTPNKHGSAKAIKSGARSQTKSLASKSKSKLAKSEMHSPTKSDKKDPSASFSPQSPGSTSSLKENDSLTNGIASNSTNSVLNNATISALDNNSKLSQSHIYYPTQGGSANGIQQSLLMDSPSSIASSNSSTNIPYAANASTDSGTNSILRAALQKSTNNITGSPSSSNNSNPPTPTTINQTNGMPFSDLNSHVYNSSRHNLYGNNTTSYQNNMPFGSYNCNTYQYQSSIGSDANKQQMFNQTFFQPTNMQPDPYNSTGDSSTYYASNLALASTTGGSSLLTPTSVPMPDSSSPGSTSTSSSASSNFSNNRNSSSHIYSSYYNNQHALPQQNSIASTAQPIYQNMYKGIQSQYSTSNLYDQTLMNSSSSYYDLNRQSMQSAVSATETSALEQMNGSNNGASGNTAAESKLSSNSSLLNPASSSTTSFDEVTQFQELLKPQPQVVTSYYN